MRSDMKKFFAENKRLSTTLALAALCIAGTAPSFAQPISSANNSSESARALAHASTETRGWSGIARESHRQTANLETKVEHSLVGGTQQNELSAEFGYWDEGTER
jgi:hypothetical protein